MNTQPDSISKIDTAKDAADFVALLRLADTQRSTVRARVKGIVDGVQPYNSATLKADGQSHRTNVNFREAEQYLGLALSAFYDLHSECPTLATVNCALEDESSATYSRVLTDEFDKLQKADKSGDSHTQLQHHEMVMYGTGPYFFDNQLDWRCRSMRSASLLVPEGTPTDQSEWESVVILSPSKVHKLYDYIKNEDAANSVGWDPKAVKESIMKASPQTSEPNRQWEWHQQQLRNNTTIYSARANEIRLAHIMVLEEDGMISHYIIDEQNTDSFLYKKRSKYMSWCEVVHPMYYDKGDGEHHSVKGMGVKMYSIMELKNRSKCTLVDAAAFRGQTLIQPTSTQAMQNSTIISKGPYSVVPPDYQVIPQQPVGALDAPLALDNALDNVLAGNLSQYRQRIEKPNGNPRTAYEIQAIMAQQSTIGKTQISRYYEQMDAVYAEKFKRAATANVSKDTVYGKMALKFRKACKDRGVPKEAMESCSVTATRVVGQGSAAMRSQALETLLPISGSLPPAGQQNLLVDYIASKVGQSMVPRYYPESKTTSADQDQAALATMERATIKEGVIPLVTGTQNHLVHAQIHIADGAASIDALQHNPEASSEVASFLMGLVQHTAQHMQGLQADKLKQQEFKLLSGQFEQLAKIAQDLAGQVGGEQGEQQPQQPGNNEEAMKAMAFANDQKRKDATVQADIQRKSVKAQQDMALKDAKTAAAIRRTAAKEKDMNA